MDVDQVGREMARALFEMGEQCGREKVGRIEFKSDVGNAIYDDDCGTSKERGLGGMCEDSIAVWIAEELRKRLPQPVVVGTDMATGQSTGRLLKVCRDCGDWREVDGECHCKRGS